MARQINLNQKPFWDDTDPAKEFYHVAYRDSYVVQARELNQMQTLQQEQQARFGSHFFKEGSVVRPGGVSVKMDQNTIKVIFEGGTNFTALFNNLDKLLIKSNSTNLTAKVISIEKQTPTEAAVIAVDYIRSADDNITTKFPDGSGVVLYYMDALNNEVPITNVNVISSHVGIHVKILAGIYYARGFFLNTEDSSMLISRFANDVSIRAGFDVVEELIDEKKDNSLYSNAQGAPNFKAPGAARVKISLKLASRKLGETDNSFIELVKVVDGLLQTVTESTEYNLLDIALAQRQFETNGDFVKNQFRMECLDHMRNDNFPDGLYLPPKGDASKYVARMKPGIAYVKGFRVENIGLIDIVSDKARDTISINNGAAPAQYGNYILVENVKSLPVIGPSFVYNFLASDKSTICGTFKVRSAKQDLVLVKQKLYIFDVSWNTGYSAKDAKAVSYSDANNLYTADLTGGAFTVYDGAYDSLIFPLNYGAIKTMLTSGGSSSDTNYKITRSIDVTLNSSGVGSYSISGSELFHTINPVDYAVAKTGSNNDGQSYPISSLSLGGSPTGRILNINIPGASNQKVKVLCSIYKSNPQQKNKTLTTQTETITITKGKTFGILSKADCYSLTSVIVNGNDVTPSVSLFDGQQPSWYENGRIIFPSPFQEDTSVIVTYQYFLHSSGDYFSVDSYGGLEREYIPVVKLTSDGKSYNLSDCLDFRPVKINGTFAGYTGEIVEPQDTLRFDLEYYTNRMDAMYVTPNGNFGIAKGISGDQPTPTEVPSDALKLYDMYIPAYTYKATDILISEVDNRGYTMRDIGKLEKRIDNVEYYTTLSLLELRADSVQVLDANGNNRFKNGFAVEGFNDFKMADIMDVNWEAARQVDRKRLVAPFSECPSNLLFVDNNLRIKNTGSAIMLNWDDALIIDQPIATRWSNINPYAVFTWAGSITLKPTTDYWVDTQYNAPIIINQTDDQTNGARPGTTSQQQTAVSTTVSDGNRFQTFGNTFQGSVQPLGSMTTTTTTNTTFTQTQIQSSLASSTSDIQVGTQIIPFMRTLDINYELKNFKPFTRVYAFFDGIAVSNRCIPDGGAMGDATITDASGSAKGIFRVPNDPSYRFRTGTSVLRFTDSATDSRAIGAMTTDGQGVFLSGGSLVTRQQTTTNVTTLRPVVATWVTTSSTTQVNRPPIISFGGGNRDRGRDPIAQTFSINLSGGGFISKVGIFFRSKAQNIPVTLQIRPCENGLPTTDVLPFGEVVLTPDQVTTSTNGSAETFFTFPTPLYLGENEEYAIVLLADTQEYECYIARMGENVIGKSYALAQQANLGVFLSSSNGNTWTPNQLEDLTFRVYRCKFNVGTFGASFTGSDPLPNRMIFNPLSTTTGSNIVTVTYRNHGFNLGDSVILSNIPTGNGIVGLPTWTTSVTQVIDADNFTVVAASNANVTGSYGGGDVQIVCNAPYVSMTPQVNQLTFRNTDIEWSFNPAEWPNGNRLGFIKYDPNANVNLKFRCVEKKGLVNQYLVNLSTTQDNLSPMIDIELGCILTDNRINTPDLDKPEKGIYKYVSKTLRFDNPSTSARFWIGAKLPGSSGIRLYYKALITGDEDLYNDDTIPWVNLLPTTPIINSDKVFNEFSFLLDGIGKFIGYRILIVMYGDNATQTPELSDIRTIALA